MQVIEKEKIIDDSEIIKGNIYIDKAYQQIYFKCFICNKPLHFPLCRWKVIEEDNKVAISPFIPCYHCDNNYVIKNSNIIAYSDKVLKDKENEKELMGI